MFYLFLGLTSLNLLATTVLCWIALGNTIQRSTGHFVPNDNIEDKHDRTMVFTGTSIALTFLFFILMLRYW